MKFFLFFLALCVVAGLLTWRKSPRTRARLMFAITVLVTAIYFFVPSTI